MNHTGTQTINTERLVLRRFTLDDVGDVYTNWASDDLVTRYLHWETHPDQVVTREVLKMWIDSYKEEGFYNWAVTMNGMAIGNIAVVNCNYNDQWAEIGYALGRAYWGRGIMSEALHAVMGYLFETVGLHRIMLRHDTENIGSGRVMQKNGMTHEGILRKEHLRKDGTWADIAVYGILSEEWAHMRNAAQ